MTTILNRQTKLFISNREKWSLLPAFMVVILIAFILNVNVDIQVPVALRDVAISPAEPLTPFEFVDHEQKVINLERLKNKWSFLFFGFTNCPDICPATLSQLILIKKAIIKSSDYAGDLQFLFVSVDPERDTREHLAEYMAYFDSSFIGMTGQEEKIADFEAQLGAYHRYGPKDKHGYYPVQHSAEVYLINPAGQLTAKFRPPMDPSLVSEQFSEFVRYFSREVS